jgi:hypothetical protein
MHDLRRLGISNGSLDKAAPLGAGEWERLRLQPHLTQRMLRQSKALAPLRTIRQLVIAPQDRLQSRRAHLREDRRADPRGRGLFAIRHGLLPEEEFRRSADLHRPQVPLHDGSGLAQLLRGTEHHELGSRLVAHRAVPGRRVEGISGRVDLFAFIEG